VDYRTHQGRNKVRHDMEYLSLSEYAVGHSEENWKPTDCGWPSVRNSHYHSGKRTGVGVLSADCDYG
jgi:hypothetical protein